jgi:hypothetical protein
MTLPAGVIDAESVALHRGPEPARGRGDDLSRGALLKARYALLMISAGRVRVRFFLFPGPVLLELLDTLAD